jgi:hypothetical protein
VKEYLNFLNRLTDGSFSVEAAEESLDLAEEPLDLVMSISI